MFYRDCLQSNSGVNARWAIAGLTWSGLACVQRRKQAFSTAAVRTVVDNL